MFPRTYTSVVFKINISEFDEPPLPLRWETFFVENLCKLHKSTDFYCINQTGRIQLQIIATCLNRRRKLNASDESFYARLSVGNGRRCERRQPLDVHVGLLIEREFLLNLSKTIHRPTLACKKPPTPQPLTHSHDTIMSRIFLFALDSFLQNVCKTKLSTWRHRMFSAVLGTEAFIRLIGTSWFICWLMLDSNKNHMTSFRFHVGNRNVNWILCMRRARTLLNHRLFNMPNN